MYLVSDEIQLPNAITIPYTGNNFRYNFCLISRTAYFVVRYHRFLVSTRYSPSWERLSLNRESIFSLWRISLCAIYMITFRFVKVGQFCRMSSSLFLLGKFKQDGLYISDAFSNNKKISLVINMLPWRKYVLLVQRDWQNSSVKYNLWLDFSRYTFTHNRVTLVVVNKSRWEKCFQPYTHRE